MSDEQQNTPTPDEKRIGDGLRTLAGRLSNVVDDWSDERDAGSFAGSVLMGVQELRRIADAAEEMVVSGQPLKDDREDEGDGE